MLVIKAKHAFLVNESFDVFVSSYDEYVKIMSREHNIRYSIPEKVDEKEKDKIRDYILNEVKEMVSGGHEFIDMDEIMVNCLYLKYYKNGE